MKEYSENLTAKNKSGGRCQARGAKTRIQASHMHERLIDGIEKPRRTPKPRIPTKSELLDMIAQTKAATICHPDSVTAQRRLQALTQAYQQLYKGER